LVTLLGLVVAVKSRMFFSFPYSADEQVCRSWEGSTARQVAKLANGNIPYHRCGAQFETKFSYSLPSFALKFCASLKLVAFELSLYLNLILCGRVKGHPGSIHRLPDE